MRALRFELKGKTAFFKKPDVNVYAYFTYNHIHKVALLGLLGAILGLGGYMQQYEKNQSRSDKKGKEVPAVFPEFYDVLHPLQAAIVPHGDRGYFPKKIQIFNNTVGYASLEEGNVLNVREQWLENPHWTIYVADRNGERQDIFNKLCEYVTGNQAVYMPYLGKNDHPATIESPAVVELKSPREVMFIDSLYVSENISVAPFGDVKNNELQCFYQEFLPIGLNRENNGYVYAQLAFTNQEIDEDTLSDSDWERLFSDDDRNLYFI